MGVMKEDGKRGEYEEIFHSPNYGAEATKLETTMCKTSVQAIDFIIKRKYANRNNARHFQRPS